MKSTVIDAAMLLRAATFAADKHRHQRRKDGDASPYINHPLAVACLLALEANVQDETLLVAALLHDTVEDTETTLEELEENFGSAVRGVVEEVTDDKSLPKQARKTLQVDHAPYASVAAKQLKIVYLRQGCVAVFLRWPGCRAGAERRPAARRSSNVWACGRHERSEWGSGRRARWVA